MTKFLDVAAQWWDEAFKQGTADQFIADVDGDGKPEILLGGKSSSAGGWGGELRIINFEPPGQLVLRHREVWGGTGRADVSAYCEVRAVYAADIDADGVVEIITGGSTTAYLTDKFGIRRQGSTMAHLRVFTWDGRNLKLKHEQTWAPQTFTNACINSLWAADIDGDGKVEVVCGGSAWVVDTFFRMEVAWFEAVDTKSWVTRGQKHWLVVGETYQGPPDTYSIEKLTVADADQDGKAELVTLSQHGRDDEYGLTVWAEAELKVWDVINDSGVLDFKLKAETSWRHHDVMLPSSLWVGDIGDAEVKTGIRIVTACSDVNGPSRGNVPFDALYADLRVWRVVGKNLTAVNTGTFMFSKQPDAFWATAPNEVQGADVDGDGKLELICTFNCALQESWLIVDLRAINPRADFKTAPDAQVFLRSYTFGCEVEGTGRPVDTWATGLRVFDLDADGTTEFIVSCNYGKMQGGEIVFIFQ